MKSSAEVKLRPGMQVDVQHHNAVRVQPGKIVSIDSTGLKGDWYLVNVGDKKNPLERYYRKAQLTPKGK